MRTKITLTSLVLASALSVSAEAQTQLVSMSQDAELAQLAESWEEITELFDVPGAAIALIKDGKTYVWTYGERHPETHEPVTPDTMFYIASITKTYTASAIVKLAQVGRLSLNDPMTKYLPNIKLGDDVDAASITIEDLITHRKGINSDMVVTLDAYSGDITPERYDYWLERGQVSGTTQYSNVNLTLAGRVIESITGMGWRDYLAADVFNPAGMTRTTGYASVMYNDDDAAFPTVWNGENWVVAAQRKTDRTMHAAGGLGTSVRDAATWLQLHLNGGSINGVDILASESARSMHTLHAPLEKPNGTIRIIEGFGYGWNVGTYINHTPLSSHGGGYVGTSTWFGILPELNGGVAILTNGGGRANAWVSIVAVEVLEYLTGESPDWSPRENFTTRVKKLRKENGSARRVDTGIATVSTDHLTRPLDFYTGWYYNEHVGTLVVERTAEMFTIRLGDYYITSTPGDSPDSFNVDDMSGPDSGIRFVVDELGYINSVEVNDAALGATRTFVR